MSDLVDIQDVLICPNENYGAGVKCKLFYAPASFFFYTPLPKPTEPFESEIEVNDGILIKAGKQLRVIDILIDENELKNTYSGANGRKKTKTSLSIFILGYRSKVLGFLERAKNEALIFFIEDYSGNKIQIGHLRNRAFLENIEATSGKKYEDNAGATVSIIANTPILIYNGSLDHFSKPGDFNNDFNNDFFKTYD